MSFLRSECVFIDEDSLEQSEKLKKESEGIICNRVPVI